MGKYVDVDLLGEGPYDLKSFPTMGVVWRRRLAREVFDIETAIKILRVLAEVKEASFSELVEKAHLSWSTVSKYVGWMANQGLVTVEKRGKSKIVRITDKGYEALLAAQRVYALFGFPLE